MTTIAMFIIWILGMPVITAILLYIDNRLPWHRKMEDFPFVAILFWPVFIPFFVIGYALIASFYFIVKLLFKIFSLEEL